MRICFITQEYAGVTHPITGGIGNWISGLAPALANLGHEVHVVVPAPTAALPPKGVTVHSAGSLRPGAVGHLFSLIFAPLTMARCVEGIGGVDIVVAQDYLGLGASASRRRHLGVFVTHLHSTTEQIKHWQPEAATSRVGFLVERIQITRERSQARRSDAVIGCSAAVLRDTISRWNLTRPTTGVLPSVVDIDRIRRLGSGETVPKTWFEGDRAVVFAGRLYPLKGVEVLTRAMRLLWEEGREERLYLIGADGGWNDDSMADRLRKVAGPWHDRLHFEGNRPPTELFPRLAAADVVALPSFWEALPLTLLEAMALGRAVVSTTGHGADDVIRNGVDGLLVTPRDVVELSNAIRRLLEDPAFAAELGKNAKRRAEQFDLAVGAKRFERFYEGLVGGHRGGVTS